MTRADEELKASREKLVSRFAKGGAPNEFGAVYTEMVDQYFKGGLQESKVGQRLFAKKRRFAIVAVGGYGRKELCLHSDIDVMVLFGTSVPKPAKELAHEIFFPLWDLGFDLGYAVRRIKDCLTLSKDDFQVLTSLMDARFVCGDSGLYLELVESMQKKVITKKAASFARWLDDRNKVRMDQSGDASYLLEPDLKEGIGGLRDYHHILWLARAFFNLRVPRDLEVLGKLSYKEYADLSVQLKFIWLVRNHLHFLSQRKNDRLTFEFQEQIAQRLGFRNKKDSLAVEQFMGLLHAHMAAIKSLHGFFVRNHLPKRVGKKTECSRIDSVEGLLLYPEEIGYDSATAILSDPLLLMAIFEQSALNGCPLSLEARRLVREFLFLVDDGFRGSARAIQGFLLVMNQPNAFDTLEQMYETGFLEKFIPEFKRVKDRVQFDAYHMYPVGRHSLETVRELKTLVNQNELLLQAIFSDLSNPEWLFLAALFHDIGKVGKNHACKGTEITRNILARFHYEKEATEHVLFLITYHLLLVETATRRDINDEKVVVQLARILGEPERLKMLYLLTWADSRATGPRAWNGWIANLVQELFFKILHILERHELATPHASKQFKKTRRQVRRLMAKESVPLDLETFFDAMSPRYILNTAPQDIVHHLGMVQQLNKGLQNGDSHAFVLEATADLDESCWEVTFLAKDRPGLFSDLAGVLALKDINILSAHIYTWRDGTAVDIFKVTSPLDTIRPADTWQAVRSDLKDTFSGKLSLEYRLGKKAAPSILSPPPMPSPPPQVHVDNDASDFFTLVEVFADDQVGLLFRITRMLFDLRLDIRIAKVATKGDQIADVFYVRDLEGQKVEDQDQVREIERALVHILEQDR